MNKRLIYVVLSFSIVSLVWGFPSDMVMIPAGTFQMGDSIGEGYAWMLNALPVHTVTLDSFAMGKYEVTNRQYCDYLNSALHKGDIVVNLYTLWVYSSSGFYCVISINFENDPWFSSPIVYSGGAFSVRTKGGRDMSNDPMVYVSYQGAIAYCNWRSQQEGKRECYNLSTRTCDFTKNGYRLATEAEWEYAARGGLEGKRFPWGNTITHSQANYISDSSYSFDISPTRGYHPTWYDEIYPCTAPVGSFPANGYGIFDMVGNVSEFCNDVFSRTYYSSSPQNNPTGPTTGNSYVMRGGSWSSSAAPVSWRSSFPLDTASREMGFRVVLGIPCATNTAGLKQNDATWGDCGLGEPGSISQIPNKYLSAMRAEPYKAVGLEDKYGKLLPGQSYEDFCKEQVNNQWKIQYKGCVLTSATMIVNALLGNNLTPDTMNQWKIFDNWPKLITNKVNWVLVKNAISVEAKTPYIHKRVEINMEPTNEECSKKIQDIICNYNVPVAVRVNDRHTVVAYAVKNEETGIRILIHDPGNNWEFLDHYKKVNHIDYIYPGSKSPKRITSQIVMNSPAEMIITDSYGRKIGFDPRNGQTYSEIPDASYVAEWENDASVSDDPTLYIPSDRNEAFKIASIDSLPGESYTVEIIGTGDDSGLLTQVNMFPVIIPHLAVEQVLSLSPGSIETLTFKSPEPADLDLDGDVDAEDLKRFSANWMQSGLILAADIYPPEGDGIVNLYDFAEFAQYWMKP